MTDDTGLVHLCPPHGKATTPCCGAVPFELPLTDRITLRPDDVTCGEYAAKRDNELERLRAQFRNRLLPCQFCRRTEGHEPTCYTLTIRPLENLKD